MSLEDYREATYHFIQACVALQQAEFAANQHGRNKPTAPQKKRLNPHQENYIEDSTREEILQGEIRKRFGRRVPTEKALQSLRRELAPRIRRATLGAFRDAKGPVNEERKRYKTALERWRTLDAQLQSELVEAREKRKSDRELVDLFFDHEVWHSLPQLNSDQIQNAPNLFYRGTLGRRLIIHPTQPTPGIVHMDSFMMGDTVEYATDLSVAISFAQTGLTNDKAHRWDPVVVITDIGDGLSTGSANLSNSKLTIGTGYLVQHCTNWVHRGPQKN